VLVVDAADIVNQIVAIMQVMCTTRVLFYLCYIRLSLNRVVSSSSVAVCQARLSMCDAGGL
jgi:hypothetical protein